MENLENAQKQAQKPKSKTGLLVVLVLLIVAALGAAYYYFFMAAEFDEAPPSLSLEAQGLEGFIGVERPLRMDFGDGLVADIEGEFLAMTEDDIKSDADIAALKAEFGNPVKVSSGGMVYFDKETARGDILDQIVFKADDIAKGILCYTVTWEPAADLEKNEPFHLMPESVFSSLRVTEVDMDYKAAANTVQAVYCAAQSPTAENVLKGISFEIYGVKDGEMPPAASTFDRANALTERWYLVASPHNDLADLVSDCPDEVSAVWYQTGNRFGQFEKADLDNFSVDPDYYMAWIRTSADYDGCVTGPVACPEDAMICPDGTEVSRVAPSCEFAACPLDEEPPADVTGVVAEPLDSAVTVSWDASTDNVAVAGYGLLYAAADVQSADDVEFVEVGNVLEYAVAGLVNDTAYIFSVVAFDASQNASNPSAWVEATPVATADNPPDNPTVPGGFVLSPEQMENIRDILNKTDDGDGGDAGDGDGGLDLSGIDFSGLRPIQPTFNTDAINVDLSGLNLGGGDVDSCGGMDEFEDRDGVLYSCRDQVWVPYTCSRIGGTKYLDMSSVLYKCDYADTDGKYAKVSCRSGDTLSALDYMYECNVPAGNVLTKATCAIDPGIRYFASGDSMYECDDNSWKLLDTCENDLRNTSRVPIAETIYICENYTWIEDRCSNSTKDFFGDYTYLCNNERWTKDKRCHGEFDGDLYDDINGVLYICNLLPSDGYVWQVDTCELSLNPAANLKGANGTVYECTIDGIYEKKY